MNPFDKEAFYYNIFHKNRDYKKEARDIKSILPEAKTILELGCGTGLLSVELEKLGFKVTGVDSSAEMLKYYKGKQYLHSLIQDLTLPRRKYDLTVALYDVLNYLNSEDYYKFLFLNYHLSKGLIFKQWDKNNGVKPFTFKKQKGCYRIRFGFRWFNNIHLWFIFWGKGLLVTHHKLYFH
jgi:SAM-dependent methyltransferase